MRDLIIIIMDIKKMFILPKVYKKKKMKIKIIKVNIQIKIKEKKNLISLDQVLNLQEKNF